MEALQFKNVDQFVSFRGEYAFVGNDIVFHFFRGAGDTQYCGHEFWKKKFPETLDKCAQEYWEASYPRIKAAFTEELDSWWLRCFDFGHIGDPEARIFRFLEKLDDAAL